MQEQELLQSKQVGAKKALERSQKNLADKLAAKGLKLPLYPTPQLLSVLVQSWEVLTTTLLVTLYNRY